MKKLGIISSSEIHNSSFSKMLLQCLEGNSSLHFLISGATDDAMLRLLHETCMVHGIDGKFSAVDICDTPLFMMRQYASTHALSLTTYHRDILDLELDLNVDIVITHAFLGNFSVEHRPRLLRKWAGFLKPGGHALTIQRIRPYADKAIISFSQPQRDDLINRAITMAKRHGITSPSELEFIQELSSQFAQHFTVYPVTTVEEIKDLFLKSGFSILTLNQDQLKQEFTHRLNPGPSVAGNASYVHIIACKA